jgi:hypothetical protein
MEFHANAMLGTPLNVGQSCGAVNCSGDDRHGPGWEMGRNHYKFRANLGSSIPATEKFVTTINRPVGTSENHFVEWTTLTHADLGNIPLPVAVRNARDTRKNPALSAQNQVFFYQQGSHVRFSSGRIPETNSSPLARIEIINLKGERVSVLKSGAVSAPNPAIPELSTGTYIYTIK